MSFFMCVLQLLKVLTTLTAANVFEFDNDQRKFEVRLSPQRIVACISNTTLIVAIALTIVIMLLCTVMVSSIFLGMLDFEYVSSEAMAVSVFLLSTTKLCFMIYVNFIFKFRLGRLLQVLNDFVDCYDLHASVYGSPLCINWIVLMCWALTTLILDPFFWVAYFTVNNSLVFFFIYVLLWPSTLLSLVSIFGVTLLEAFYAAVELDTAKYRPMELLNFYDRIQQLRCSLDSLISFNVSIELLIGFAAVTFGVIQYLSDRETFLSIPIILLPLSYSGFLTYCTDSMNRAEQKIGDQVTRKLGKNSLQRQKVLQLWLLARYCILSGFKSRMSVLNMEKGILLEVASYGFVFGIFVMNYVLQST